MNDISPAPIAELMEQDGTGLSCRLTVPMRLEHRGDTPDHLYLTFRRTGLMVEVLDLPMDGGALPAAVPLRRVDAHGLGLSPDDFVEGVAACHEAHDGPDEIRGEWACASMTLIGVDDDRAPVLLADAPSAARWLAAA